MKRAWVMAVLLGAPVLAGCLGPTETSEAPLDPDAADWPRCEHPWPCGGGAEWPVGLAGPFDLARMLEVRVPSHDGVDLFGWVFLPRLPDGVRAPVVLVSSPYLGVERLPSAGLNPDGWQAMLLENGYAVAMVSVRGTGASGGCFEKEGPSERGDQAALVEWLAAQEWSNGRVAMVGLSYTGQTAMQGAIEAPPSLKAVVAMAVESVYTFHFTPQGAMSGNAPHYEMVRRVFTNWVPATEGELASYYAAKFATTPERVCPEFLRSQSAVLRGMLTGDRDAAYFDARQYAPHYPNVTAAVLITQGFRDPSVYWGQDTAWPGLHSPKRMVWGPWGHEPPPGKVFDAEVLAWLDHFLKGAAPVPPGLGQVLYQDVADVWRESGAWPPEEGRDEALLLGEGALGSRAPAGLVRFRSAPTQMERGPQEFLCPSPFQAPFGVGFISDALPESALVAGNPMLWLRLASDQPGGLVAAHLFRIPSEAGCEAAETLSFGAADLRFHAGGYAGRGFPVDHEEGVRIDLRSLAVALEAGDRLALVLSHGGPFTQEDLVAQEFLGLGSGNQAAGRAGDGHFPELTVRMGPDASHLVLPLAAGTLGGEPPTREYPPRPFAPPEVQ